MTGNHDARERLIAAAERLLTRSGPGSVSMDAVAAAAGAGKMSAYRHFASKDDLVAAALERHNPRHVRWLVGAGQTVESILSAFERLESAAGSEPFRGCPFVDAALAAPGTDDRPGRIAWRHKQQVTRELAGLAARAGLPEPGELGAAVALVIDGAAVQAALAPDPASRQQIVRRARHAAEVLLAVAAQRAPGVPGEGPGPEGPGERVWPGGRS
jgi:AcrR family transcriptional regulator